MTATGPRHDPFVRKGAKRPECLHPNLETVQAQRWGARAFGVVDRTCVRIVFRQW